MVVAASRTLATAGFSLVLVFCGVWYGMVCNCVQCHHLPNGGAGRDIFIINKTVKHPTGADAAGSLFAKSASRASFKGSGRQMVVWYGRGL